MSNHNYARSMAETAQSTLVGGTVTSVFVTAADEGKEVKND